MPRKPTHGGKRPGAGRPKGAKRVPLTIRPLEASAATFKTYCGANGLSYEKGFERIVSGLTAQF